MVKSYLRYVPEVNLGTITSFNSNSVVHPNGRWIIVPALENVNVWDFKKGILIKTLSEPENISEVTCLCLSSDGKLAAGYNDGMIRIWDLETGQNNISFNGHAAAVTALRFDSKAEKLASGSKDTDIIIWDMFEETGLYRFKGHKDQVTGLVFLSENNLNHLVSVAKDTLLKVWDMSSQHCIETQIAHRSEVWCLDVDRDQKFLFTAAMDQEIRVWDIHHQIIETKLNPVAAMDTSDSSNLNEEGVVKSGVTLRGIIERSSKERAVTLKMHPHGTYFGVQGGDRMIEVFKMLSPEEIKKKLNRKRKRQKEKKKKNEDKDAMEEDTVEQTVADEINAQPVIRCSAKCRSFDFISGKKDSLLIAASLTSNAIEVHQLSPEEEEPTKLVSSIDLQGHRSDVRAVALSADDDLLFSGSNSGIKIWNIPNRQCIKSMDSGYVLCGTFVPGNKHVVVGTKTGEIEIYDLASSSMIESIKAHDGPVWSLEVGPDKCGLVSGSADKSVKFWDFSLVQDESYSRVTKRLSLVHTRTLKMSDDVLCVRHSPDGKYLAVSLLDSTVKVFFFDTLKFFLSLYGHKLPVLSMDISSDSSLIITGSADKSVKIWGLDFGDCHKSIYAHTDSVMNVKFVWGTHYFFSVGKDKLVKYWDADKLQGHHGEVWALAVAKYGAFVVTGSHDRSIRIWTKTDEQLFLEEEREKELEEAYEKHALEDKYENKAIGSGVEDENGNLPEIEQSELGKATKKTSESLKAGERILQALEVYESELAAFAEYQESNPDAVRPPRNPYIQALGDLEMLPEQYVLRVMMGIKVSELDEALMLLPFSKLPDLLKCIHTWVDKNWNLSLATRTLHFLLSLHHKQIMSSSSLKPVLLEIQSVLPQRLREQQDMMGYNMAALKMINKELESRAVVGFQDESKPAAIEVADGKRGEKRKRVVMISA